jgi:beta-glucosidase
MAGRPLTIGWLAENVPALLEAWYLGTENGHAIADVLFGDYNPSGRLPISFPRAVGQIPVYYAQRSTGRPQTGPDQPWVSKYVDLPNDPLYPFGFGLAYTTFEYSAPRLSRTVMDMHDALQVSVTVKNTGLRAGEEVVQLYVRDLVASVTRPVKELRGFEKVALAAGEGREVRFTLTASDLAFWDRDMRLSTEPGDFAVMVGPNSRDLQTAAFRLE